MKAFLSRENMANDWNKIGILAEITGVAFDT